MSLKEQLDRFAKIAELRAEAAIKDAVSTMSESMNTPIAKGGNMPVDLGFLRNSIAAQVDGVPSGLGSPPSGFEPSSNPNGAVSVVVEQWDVKRPLTIGWTASYAPYMENRYGFLEAGLQRFPEFFESAIKRAKQEIV